MVEGVIFSDRYSIASVRVFAKQLDIFFRTL